jgi:hypothetical protein
VRNLLQSKWTRASPSDDKRSTAESRIKQIESTQVRPQTELARLYKRIGTSRGWFGADLYIMPENFGLACEALAAALERYVRDPGARVESADDAKQSRLERVTESEIRIDSP